MERHVLEQRSKSSGWQIMIIRFAAVIGILSRTPCSHSDGNGCMHLLLPRLLLHQIPGDWRHPFPRAKQFLAWDFMLTEQLVVWERERERAGDLLHFRSFDFFSSAFALSPLSSHLGGAEHTGSILDYLVFVCNCFSLKD